MKQMILKIDEAASFDAMPENIQAIAQSANIQWPEGTLIGTKAYRKKRLVLILADVDGDTLNDWLINGYPTTDENGDPVTIDLGLSWRVIAHEDKKVDQGKLLPYFLPTPIIDENGEQTGTEPVTDLTGKLQTWAGHKWIY